MVADFAVVHMLGEQCLYVSINIPEHQRQQSMWAPRNVSFLDNTQINFEWSTIQTLKQIWYFKYCIFNNAACFADAHMLGEQSFLYPLNIIIWTLVTAKYAATVEFIIFWITHNPTFTENIIPKRFAVNGVEIC